MAPRLLYAITPKAGIDIVRKAVVWPPGSDGSIVIGKLPKSKDANYGRRKASSPT